MDICLPCHSLYFAVSNKCLDALSKYNIAGVSYKLPKNVCLIGNSKGLFFHIVNIRSVS